MSGPPEHVTAVAGEGLSGSMSAMEARLRICPSCGRRIQWEASFCPYCSWSQGQIVGAAVLRDPISSGKRVALYFCSILIPFFGIVVGAMYLGRVDDDHRSVGTICLVLGAVSLFVVMPTVLAALLYVMVLGF